MSLFRSFIGFLNSCLSCDGIQKNYYRKWREKNGKIREILQFWRIRFNLFLITKKKLIKYLKNLMNKNILYKILESLFCFLSLSK